MSGDQIYQEELDYLVDYAQVSPVYFFPVRDAAEAIAGDSASESEIRASTLRLISDMLDRGVQIGDMSSKKGETLVPWRVSKEAALSRVADEMRRLDDPMEFIKICWFSAGE